MRRPIRLLLLSVLAVVVMAVVAVLVFYARDEASLAAQARATPQVPAKAAAGQERPATVELPRDVNVATVHLLNGREDILVVDVRSEGAYEQGHVPGAMSAPTDELEARLAEVPHEAKVIVTCRSGRSSAGAVDRLLAAGFTNVHQMIGGMRAWVKAGYELEE